MVRKLVLAGLLFALAAPAFGADLDAERDRKARVALALAGGKPAIQAAPPPRAVVPKDYPAGHAKAVADELPLVVFVGCRGAHTVAGAVVSRVEEFAGTKGPAVVIGYPVRDRVWVHATLPCPVTDADLSAAVKAAAKKIADPPAKAMPAPVPLDWTIRAEVKPACQCGPDCLSAKKVADPRDSLVRVRKGNAQGSGTVIYAARGRSVILTAAHVVEHGGELSVRGQGKTHAATVLASDRSADLAALLIEVELPAVQLSANDPADGAEVVMIGMTSLFSRGRISGREVLNGHEQIVYATAADSDGGDSGAGVYFEGKLCGVHLGKIGTETSAKPRAVAVRVVRAFLSRVFRREGARFVPAVPVAVAKAEAPKGTPANPSQPGDVWTTSGAVIRQGTDGVWRYVGQAPRSNAAPNCPLGKCPLK